MDSAELRALQQPLKDRYRADPDSAVITLRARGALDAETISCKVETSRAIAAAGLHPATGGDGTFACSGDMLLEAADAAHMQSLQRTLSERGISAALRFVNDPSRIKGDNAFYRNMLRGSCCDSAWRRRRGSRWWRRTDICRSSETMVTPNPVGGICRRSGW